MKLEKRARDSRTTLPDYRLLFGGYCRIYHTQDDLLDLEGERDNLRIELEMRRGEVVRTQEEMREHVREKVTVVRSYLGKLDISRPDYSTTTID